MVSFFTPGHTSSVQWIGAWKNISDQWYLSSKSCDKSVQSERSCPEFCSSSILHQSWRSLLRRLHLLRRAGMACTRPGGGRCWGQLMCLLQGVIVRKYSGRRRVCNPSKLGPPCAPATGAMDRLQLVGTSAYDGMCDSHDFDRMDDGAYQHDIIAVHKMSWANRRAWNDHLS